MSTAAPTPTPTLQEVWDLLDEEVRAAEFAVAALRRLYIHDDGMSRVGLWSKTAPEFHDLAIDAFADRVIMCLCRLADPKRTGSNENFSLDYAMEALGLLSANGSRMTADIIDDVKRLKSKVHDVVRYRNKSIAHRDRDDALLKKGLKPQTFKFKDVVDAVEILDSIMDQLHVHCFGSNIRRLDAHTGGVADLEGWLAYGMNWHRLWSEARTLGPDRVFEIACRGEFPQEQPA